MPHPPLTVAKLACCGPAPSGCRQCALRCRRGSGSTPPRRSRPARPWTTSYGSPPAVARTDADVERRVRLWLAD